MSFIKKSWFLNLLVSFLFLLIVSPDPALAQVVIDSKTTKVVTENQVPLVVKINNVAYSNDKRLISVDFVVTNESDAFVDDLRYSFELHQGEKLADSGMLFRDLQYVMSFSGTYEKMHPRQSRRLTVQYTLPETIPGGPYFLRGTVYNEELSVYGVTYTKEPVRLTGRGGFILNKIAGLVDLKNKKVYQPMEGPTLEKDGEYLIALPKNPNQSLFDALEKEEIYSDLKITHISDRDKIVYEKLNIPLSTLVREDGLGLEFKVEPWSDIKSGSHTALISFKNSKGEQISENLTVRLLYRGLLGRIYQTDTNINSYRKGEPIKLLANVVAAGDPDAKKVFLKAVLKNKGEVVQEIQKEVELNGEFQGTDVNVDFSDIKINKKTLIDQIDLFLVSESGEVLDDQIIKMDTNQIFAYPRDSHWLRNILISLLLLVIAVVIWAFVKKKINFTLASIVIAVVFVGGSVIFSDPNLISAQSGNSNDDVWGCTSSSAINYNEFATQDDGSCEYRPETYGCTDSAATNYNSSATANDGSCEYGPPIVRGCTNPNASNYNSSATEDDGSCYTDTYGCTNPSATNYNSSATFDDGSCNYDQSGCTDSNALNFDPSATVDNGTCEYEPSVRSKMDVFQRDLIDIWSVPEELPSGDQGVCDEDCIPTEFYVKIQCKECGNQSLDIYIDYFNNWRGTTAASQSIHDRSYVVNTTSDYMLYEFNIYLAQSESSNNMVYSEELEPAKNSKLIGGTVNANDVINEWIFGPFLFDFCFENFDANGSIIKSLSDEEDGLYHQNYAVQAVTNFGGDYCQAQNPDGTLSSGAGGERVLREMMCSIPAELRASFFIDYNEDGSKNVDEPYIKSGDASESCYGSTGAPLGFIRNSSSSLSVGGLSPDNCEGDNVPYFFQDLLVPANYQSRLDPDNAFGWIQTGVQYFMNSTWITNEGFIPLISSDVMKSLIGLRRDSEMPVAISCSATPRTTREFPKTVAWRIDGGTFWSDEYDISDLEFVWRGVGGPPTSDVIKSGSVENGQYAIEYNQGTGGPGEYRMSVYARNSQGETVSNTATCEVDIIPMIAACGAYGSLGAIESGSPQTFFNLTDDVYWNVDVQNGSDYMYYSWSGSYLGAESGNDGNKTIGPINYSELGVTPGTLLTANVEVDGADNVDAEASCSIFIRECLTDDDCLGGKICNLGTYTCVLPPPIFTSPLSLNPSVINTGEQCGLSWEVQNEDVCEIYKNNVLMPIDWGEGMTSLNVDAGTYTMVCRNEDGLSVTGGPVTCLMNPDIRER